MSRSSARLLNTALIAALLLTACDQSTSAPAASSAAQQTAAPTGNAVAVVNGKPISEQIFMSYARARMKERPETDINKQRQSIINELINRELIVQEAIANGLDKQPLVAGELENQRRNILAAAMIQKLVQGAALNEEQLKTEYDTAVAGAPAKEFKLRHILTASEDDAKEVIAKLDQGTPFADLAKEKSTDPSGKNGGELGWVNARQVGEEIADAAAALEKGAYRKTPVKTRFGWHVILLDDVRDLKLPEFAEVKDKLRGIIHRKNLEAHVKELRSKAKVEIMPVPAAESSKPAPAPQPE